jgi:hypothetical protein
VTLTRILEQVKAKHAGALSVDDLIYLANGALEDTPDEFWELFGIKHPGWRAEARSRRSAAKSCPASSRSASSPWVTGSYRDTRSCGRSNPQPHEDRRKKIEADVRKELTPKQTKTAWPFPTGAKAPAAKSSKKGKK